MIGHLRTPAGWYETAFKNNICHVCGSKLHLAPSGKPFCNSVHTEVGE